MAIAVRRLIHRRAFWYFLFFIATVILAWPFLSLANQPTLIFGIPSLYLYVNVTLLLTILTAFFLSRIVEEVD